MGNELLNIDTLDLLKMRMGASNLLILKSQFLLRISWISIQPGFQMILPIICFEFMVIAIFMFE